jgi:hypothetical protein
MWQERMSQILRAFAMIAVLLAASVTSGPAAAQKQGGILKMYVWDNPPSMSMLDGVNPLAQRRQWECSTISSCLTST